jgi:hypothetical protein
LEETSVKINVLREELDKKKDECLIDILSSMLSHVRHNESFEQWVSYMHDWYLGVFIDKFNKILSAKNLLFSQKRISKICMEVWENGKGKEIY